MRFTHCMNSRECVHMKQLLPRCERRIQTSCIDVLDTIDCQSAWQFCWNSFTPFFQSGFALVVERKCAEQTFYRTEPVRRYASVVRQLILMAQKPYR